MKRHPTQLVVVVLLILGGTILALASGCSQNRPAVSEISEMPAGSFALDWHQPLPIDKRLTGLYLNDKTVFAYGSGNRTFWIDASSGHLKEIARTAPADDQLFAPRTLEDRVVFPSTSQLAVYSREGRLMHEIELPYSPSSDAVGEDSMIYLGEDHPNGGRLVAMSTEPQPYGALPPKWELSVGGQLSSRPALSQGVVFAGSRAGQVYAVRADNASGIWPGLSRGFFQTDGEILADIDADSEGVYVASMDSKLYALDPNTGRVRWTYYAGEPLDARSDPVVLADTIYMYVPQVGVVAIDKTGRQEMRGHKWVVPQGRKFLAADENHVYLSSADGKILGVDRQNGEVVMSSQMEFEFFVSGDGSADTIYAATTGGDVYAIRPVLKPGTLGRRI